ncbi:hypothetical protein E2C01_092508 [Portunus trituberculatus]|uniref:Secreted protein n=1 Tax=Portunus trituberculatus TaxID=210409 RepID=A0A5B7JVM5_PORTR|nr:hypothetical protein [Portunus trituberculatus]
MVNISKNIPLPACLPACLPVCLLACLSASNCLQRCLAWNISGSDVTRMCTRDKGKVVVVVVVLDGEER